MDKNIVFIISRFLDGGIDTVLIEYLNAIVKYTDSKVTLIISIDYKEHEVFLNRIDKKVQIIHLVSNPFLTYYRRLIHQKNKIKIIGLLDELFLNPIRRCVVITKLYLIIKGYDIIIDFDNCHYSYISKIKKLRRYTRDTKYITFSHFQIKATFNENSRRIKKNINSWKHYDYIITICDAMRNIAQKLCANKQNDIHRIYNHCDSDVIIERANQIITDERINKTYFLAIERLEEPKDLETLIYAYHLYLHKNCNKNCPLLYIMGEGKKRQSVENLIEKLNLKNNVFLLGLIKNPYPWIKRAKLILFSSKSEGLPTTLIESLILNKLIISTDCPTGPAEILANGKAGLLVPVGDAKAMSQAIDDLLSNNVLKKQILNYGIEHSSNFKSQNAITTFFQLI